MQLNPRDPQDKNASLSLHQDHTSHALLSSPGWSHVYHISFMFFMQKLCLLHRLHFLPSKPTAPEDRDRISSKVGKSTNFGSYHRKRAQDTLPEPPKENGNGGLNSIPPCPC